MPHFGLMDATKMTEADASLLRSRLHMRGGKQRLQNGLFAAGIAALYELGALWHALLHCHP